VAGSPGRARPNPVDFGYAGRITAGVVHHGNRCSSPRRPMKNNPLPRLDQSPDTRERLLPFCRLQPGDVWTDPVNGHRVGCLDAADDRAVSDLMTGARATLAIHDPPYNLASFERRSIDEFVDWARQWVRASESALDAHASMYVWLGADQTDGFQPLPDFMHMMRSQEFRPRSFITMRNQRGYGTQKNWMAVRQELLYYVRGTPAFHVEAEYTEIPKILTTRQANIEVTPAKDRSTSNRTTSRIFERTKYSRIYLRTRSVRRTGARSRQSAERRRIAHHIALCMKLYTAAERIL